MDKSFFPLKGKQVSSTNNGQDFEAEFHYDDKGLTLRDWFAGIAMQAMIGGIGERYLHEDIPAMAYQFADNMLMERNKNQ